MTKHQKWQKACDEVVLQMAKVIADSAVKIVELAIAKDYDGAELEAALTQSKIEMLNLQHQITLANRPMPKSKIAKGGIVLPMNRKDNPSESDKPELVIPLNMLPKDFVGKDFHFNQDGQNVSYHIGEKPIIVPD